MIVASRLKLGACVQARTALYSASSSAPACYTEPPQASRPSVTITGARRRAARCSAGEAAASVGLIGGNTKGFALSFPNRNRRPRVAAAARPLARARHRFRFSLPLPSSPEGRPHAAGSAAFSRKEGTMTDFLLQYRACGAECRDDYLRSVAHDNGLSLACVRRIADRLGERETSGR